MKTYGLTHVALAVRDVKRSFKFYQQVLGIASVYEGDDSIQAQTPGTRDVLVFERSPKRAGKTGGIAHFGFRLVKPVAVSAIVRKVQRAGGKVLRKGEFAPGLPYAQLRSIRGSSFGPDHGLRQTVTNKGPRHRRRRGAVEAER